MKRTLLLGPPGTGKTTTQLQFMEQALNRGIKPHRIAFVSFTRAAIRDAKDLACDKFGLSYDELPLMRTLHSMCFHLLALKRGDVFGQDAMMQLSELTGELLTGKFEMDAPTLGERGDALLFLDQYSRSIQKPLEDAWNNHGAPIDWYRLKRFVDTYTNMRHRTGLLDFTDMIERAIEQDVTVDADLVLVDEAQDLSKLQWAFIYRAFRNVPEMIVSGDDDQGIYAWAGASAESLLEFDGTKEVLSQSYRLPRTVWEVARSVAAGIGTRYQKEFAPATDEYGDTREGHVEWLARPDEADLSAGRWLLLARTRRQLTGLAALAADQGVVYELAGRSSVDPQHVTDIKEYEKFRSGDPTMPLWHDALTNIPLETREYLLSCLRRDKWALTTAPRVRVDTIHGAKGLEADNVLLLTDVNARIRRGIELDSDAEARVWYVGVTRAREALYPVIGQRGRGYDIN